MQFYSILFFSFLAAILCVSNALAQIEFTEHVITDDFEGASSVFPVDLDGDGDIDILGSAYIDDEITWWENDGDGEFEVHVVTDEFVGASFVYAADVDSDGDIDILGTAHAEDQIAWWENDGEQDFTEHTIADDFIGAASVITVDLDGDGDLDVLGAADGQGVGPGGEITWWDNDGEQNFNEHIISEGNNLGGVKSVAADDLDGDGDIDVIGVGPFIPAGLVWEENDGEENFRSVRLAHNVFQVNSVITSDIDSDGDIDLVMGGGHDYHLNWWENNGEGEFNGRRAGEYYGNAKSVNVADLDADGDKEMITASNRGITWWDNDGEENYIRHIISAEFNGAASIYTADFDGDGDMDVVGAANNANEITWWESDAYPLSWLTLPPISLTEEDSIQLGMDFLFERIYAPDFPDTALVVTFADGEHIFGEFSHNGLTITAEQGWSGSDSLMLVANDPDDNSDTTFQHVDVIPLSAKDTDGMLPSALTLTSSYPNPFNSSTTITYGLPIGSQISMGLFDLSGQRVAMLVDGRIDAGVHKVTLYAADLASGMYIIHAKTSGWSQSQKVMLIK